MLRYGLILLLLVVCVVPRIWYITSLKNIFLIIRNNLPWCKYFFLQLLNIFPRTYLSKKIHVLYCPRPIHLSDLLRFLCHVSFLLFLLYSTTHSIIYSGNTINHYSHINWISLPQGPPLYSYYSATHSILIQTSLLFLAKLVPCVLADIYKLV